MGLVYNIYLNAKRIYGCKTCKTHLADHDEIISRVRLSLLPYSVPLTRFPMQNFRGQHGKAYLFNKVVNISEGPPGERNMTTGKHIVRDIRCRQCGEVVGWKYDWAYESTEKYKVDKFILEQELLSQVS